MYLVVENKGEIPINALTIVGASDKEKGNFIGKFGSGIKFAIAASLRKDIDLTMTIGRKRILFDTVETALSRSTIHRIRTKVGWNLWQNRDWTTEMGKHDWQDKPSQGVTLEYMIVREFVSNAMDEKNGFRIYASNTILPAKGLTRVYIEYTPEVQAVMNDLGLYFLQYGRECDARTPVFENKRGAAYSATSDGRIYTKGIFVRIPPRPTIFDYDFNDLQITESRTVDPYVLQGQIGRLWADLPAEQLAEALSRLEDGSVDWFESDISSWQFGDFNKATVVAAVKSIRGVKAVLIHKNVATDSCPAIPVVRVPDGLYTSLESKVDCYRPRVKKITCSVCMGTGSVDVEDDVVDDYPF